MDDVVNMLKTTISRNVVIKTSFPSDIPYITGDASQLRQIVMNLIINAAEAIGEAKGVVYALLTKTVINTGQSEKDHSGIVIPPGCYVCLEVSDSGCGMDKETKRRIFEPFFSTKFTGRGLGMSAVLGIIAAHKGALQLLSQSGQGTTFKVFLPFQSNGSVAEEPLKQAASVQWQGSGTILLAEDEEQIMTIVTMMLTRLGFKVIGASSGKEALELYQKNAAGITLVLTDIGMPVMDGYELFRELKKLDSDLPIIISSGGGDAVVTSGITHENIAGLVNKPYDFHQLRDVLKSVVLDRNRVG
ncbi:MAG: response regulator [Candidatus Ozemobacteraceae bacterium]